MISIMWTAGQAEKEFGDDFPDTVLNLMQKPDFIQGQGPWKLNVWVQPGAEVNALSGLYQGCLKIRLGAPAVDGKANKALLAYLADLLSLRKSCLKLISGKTSRRKTISVEATVEPDWSKLI